ncbi:hypothetical protein QYE76_065843 [Lolium multiflorum]|uniref:Uncharacterized protein n=1 Tax=Lolium multiflorum TaxID=4521 RepID=A0AAD8SAF5_LOLMU|nr:hypothetical protein QYE76_065843 [Lolium multiflorum]
MELLRCLYLQPSSCTKEGQEEEEAAAALMDMAGVEQQDVFSPRSMADMKRLGVACRRKGMELLIRWDSKFKVRHLVEMPLHIIAAYRAGAAKAGGELEHTSEIIEVCKYADVPEVGLRLQRLVGSVAQIWSPPA